MAWLLIAPPAHAAPGDFDPGFGSGGIVEDAGESEARAVLLQSDGKIIAVLSDGFAAARYESDGSVDTGFGTAGRATVDFGTGGQISTAAVIAPDGKIVLSGAAHGPQADQLAIARFDVNGALDPTFGTGGKTLTDVPGNLGDFTETITRLPSGRLVTAGSVFTDGSHGLLVAYDDLGALDPGFGSSGIVLMAEPSAIHAIAVAGAEIIAVGTINEGYDGHAFLARFAFDGTAGPVTILPDAGSFANGLAVDPIGRIVVAGGTHHCNDTFVARFLADGTLDPSFGTDGVAVIDVQTPATAACGDFGKALVLQPDGRMLVATESQIYDAPPSPLTFSDWWLLRLDPDGAIDTSFGAAGFVFMRSAAPSAMAMQRDGKVVTSGHTEDDPVYMPPLIYFDTTLALTRNEAMPPPICSTTPRNDCGPGGGAHSSKLKLGRRSGKPPTLQWSWKKGTATAADIGDPTSGGSYALCIYDGGNALVGTAQVEGGGVCTGKPCWKATGTSGWQYQDKRGTVFGLDKVKLKLGSGKAALAFQGKHANLPVAPLPAMLPLRVQLQTSTGSCFDAVYPTAGRNDATEFSARN